MRIFQESYLKINIFFQLEIEQVINCTFSYYSVLRLFKCSLLYKDLKNEIPGLLNEKAKRPLSLYSQNEVLPVSKKASTQSVITVLKSQNSKNNENNNTNDPSPSNRKSRAVINSDDENDNKVEISSNENENLQFQNTQINVATAPIQFTERVHIDEELTAEKLYKLAEKYEFPHKVFIADSQTKYYTPVTHFFTSKKCLIQCH